MKNCVSIQQIQDLDRRAIEEMGVPSIALMENAGRAVASEAMNRVANISHPVIGIVCGFGNNAGDGFVAARHCVNFGAEVRVLCLTPKASLKNDALINFQILERSGFDIVFCDDCPEESFKSYDLLVDAIFGVGLNREVEPPYQTIIQKMNSSKTRILAVDVPSGLSADTGQVLGECAEAETTVSFTLPKIGFFKIQALRYTGNIKVVDVGIPKCLYEESYASH